MMTILYCAGVSFAVGASMYLGMTIIKGLIHLTTHLISIAILKHKFKKMTKGVKE